jgi:hypothetical protein
MRLLRLLCLAGALASTVNASSIVYDNTSESSAGADGVDFFGPLYDSFTSAAAGPIVDLQLVLSDDRGGDSSGAVDVSLYADDASTPGDLIGILGSVSDSKLSDVPEIYGVTLTDYPLLSEDPPYCIGLSGITEAESYNDNDSSGIGGRGGIFLESIRNVFRHRRSRSNVGRARSVGRGVHSTRAVKPFLIFPGAVFLAPLRLRSRGGGTTDTTRSTSTAYQLLIGQPSRPHQ